MTVLSVSEVSKTYGATRALRGVSLDLARGEVLGLIGANGAGKSTLIKVLSGATRASSGAVRLGGRPFEPSGPLDAQAAGVQTVHQNIDDGVVPGMTVAENLTLDGFGRGGSGWFVTRGRIRERARAVAADAGLLAELDAPVESLPPSGRQRVVIARALSRAPKVLILDEPTSTLSAAEADALLPRVRALADNGVAVLYVSHRLSEIEALCDRVVVLRDGRARRTFTAPVDRHAVVAAMLGDLTPDTTPAPAVATDETEGSVLTASGVTARPGGAPFDLRVRPGEILGVTGLVGSGKTELLEQLFGARPLLSGTLTLGGAPYRPKDPGAAIGAGVALVAEERAARAVVPGWSLRAHVSLPRLGAHTVAGVLSRRAERASAEEVVRLLAVRTSGVEAAIETLSGGNQQKVVVGRWLTGSPRLLLLDEPFRGVDVGARADIGRVLRGRADGLAVLVASSDPEEVLELADRILVLHEGGLAGELRTADATAERLTGLMAGSPVEEPS
ncbi:sugar ABC transporter ATP-binding protein [Streptosporangium saharense]|uniref:sugar ABC transporter ATP-binding protein n=1 Tax=Streptosporangium saharense TaxID=1706840 RepID=UPI003427098F